jgi:hypothetical protein
MNKLTQDKNVVVALPENMPGEDLPKRPSPSRIQLCRVAWSWSPAHSREEEYSLHAGRKDWFLYLSYYNDFEGKVDHCVVARMPKAAADAESAAKKMLTEFWRLDENESEPGRFHELDAFRLSKDDLEAIADQVWGKP